MISSHPNLIDITNVDIRQLINYCIREARSYNWVITSFYEKEILKRLNDVTNTTDIGKLITVEECDSVCCLLRSSDIKTKFRAIRDRIANNM